MNIDLHHEYYKWLCYLVFPNKQECESYSKLLNELHNRDFTFILLKDENRMRDGIDLRYRFGYEYHIPNEDIKLYLDTKDGCSILEMMVALSLRCEEDIMSDINIGNRAPLWFKNMLKSLGLDQMINSFYDQNLVDKTLDNFLNRNYEPNGSGGLFTIKNFRSDLRNIDI